MDETGNNNMYKISRKLEIKRPAKSLWSCRHPKKTFFDIILNKKHYVNLEEF